MRPSITAKFVLKQIKSLQDFKLKQQQAKPIYHEPVSIPTFLTQNLVSPHRVIRQFTGQFAILKAFYYSFMRLAFEIQSEDCDYSAILKRKLIEDQEFTIGQLQDNNFTDKQYRKFLQQFVQILQNQQISNFEQTITNYPTIDQILLKMFRKLLPLPLLMKDTQQSKMQQRILHFLTQKFNITLECIKGCYKFIQSDIFLYCSSFNEVYLVYMNPLQLLNNQAEQTISNKSSRPSISSQLSTIRQSQSNKTILEPPVMPSTSILLDRSNKRDSIWPKTNYLKSSSLHKSDQIIEVNQSQSQYYSKTSSGNSPIGISNDQNKTGSISSLALSQDTDKSIKQTYKTGNNFFEHQFNQLKSSKSDHALINQKASIDKISPFSKQKNKKYALAQPSQIPSNKISQQDHLSLFSNLNSNVPQVQSLMKNTLSGRGTQNDLTDDSGYGKFTNSGVLNLLDQQYRQEIRDIKKKYRNIRHNIKQYF